MEPPMKLPQHMAPPDTATMTYPPPPRWPGPFQFSTTAVGLAGSIPAQAAAPAPVQPILPTGAAVPTQLYGAAHSYVQASPSLPPSSQQKQLYLQQYASPQSYAGHGSYPAPFTIQSHAFVPLPPTTKGTPPSTMQPVTQPSAPPPGTRLSARCPICANVFAYSSEYAVTGTDVACPFCKQAVKLPPVSLQPPQLPPPLPPPATLPLFTPSASSLGAGHSLVGSGLGMTPFLHPSPTVPLHTPALYTAAGNLLAPTSPFQPVFTSLGLPHALAAATVSAAELAEQEQVYYTLLAPYTSDFDNPYSALVWLARAQPSRTWKLAVPRTHRLPKSSGGQGGYCSAFYALGLILRESDTQTGHWHSWYAEPRRVQLKPMQAALIRRWKESEQFHPDLLAAEPGQEAEMHAQLLANGLLPVKKSRTEDKDKRDARGAKDVETIAAESAVSQHPSLLKHAVASLFHTVPSSAASTVTSNTNVTGSLQLSSASSSIKESLLLSSIRAARDFNAALPAVRSPRQSSTATTESAISHTTASTPTTHYSVSTPPMTGLLAVAAAAVRPVKQELATPSSVTTATPTTDSSTTVAMLLDEHAPARDDGTRRGHKRKQEEAASTRDDEVKPVFTTDGTPIPSSPMLSMSAVGRDASSCDDTVVPSSSTLSAAAPSVHNPEALAKRRAAELLRSHQLPSSTPSTATSSYPSSTVRLSTGPITPADETRARMLAELHASHQARLYLAAAQPAAQSQYRAPQTQLLSRPAPPLPLAQQQQRHLYPPLPQQHGLSKQLPTVQHDSAIRLPSPPAPIGTRPAARPPVTTTAATVAAHSTDASAATATATLPPAHRS